MVKLVSNPPIAITSYDEYQPNKRYDEIYLYTDTTTGAEFDDNSTTANIEMYKSTYRYKLTIIDLDVGIDLLNKKRPQLQIQQQRGRRQQQKQKQQQQQSSSNSITPVVKVMYSTAVLIIPIGRECEYMFTSRSGLVSIGQSINTCRLIVVSVSRSPIHPFVVNVVTNSNTNNNTNTTNSNTTKESIQQMIQMELTYIVQLLSRQGKFVHVYSNVYIQNDTCSNTGIDPNTNTNTNTNTIHQAGSIPFISVDDTYQQRYHLASGNTMYSGNYTIEQMTLTTNDSDHDNNNDNDDNQQAQADNTSNQHQQRIIRRLYFDNNPFVIQSEISGYLLPVVSADNSLPNHTFNNQQMQVDLSYVAFKYHQVMSAGIIASILQLQLQLQKEQTQKRQHQNDSVQVPTKIIQGLLIGLGGGGLVNYLHQYMFQSLLLHVQKQTTSVDTLSLENNMNQLSIGTISEQQHQIQEHHLLAIELDPVVIDIAQQYFNIKQTTTTPTSTNTTRNQFEIICGNGLDLQASSHTASTTETSIETNAVEVEDAKIEIKMATTIIDSVDTNNHDSQIDSTLPTTNSTISIPEHTMSYIIIDVDSKDTTIGMSCPPIEFIRIVYLQTLLQLLSITTIITSENDCDDTVVDNDTVQDKIHTANVNNTTGQRSLVSPTTISGILAINVSARDPLLLYTVCMNVAKVFSNVYISKKHKDWNHHQQSAEEKNIDNVDDDNDSNADDTDDDDDLNVVVFAQHHYCNDVDVSNASLSSSSSSSSSWLSQCTSSTMTMDERRQKFKSLFSSNSGTKSQSNDTFTNENDNSIQLLDESHIIELASCLDTMIHWTPDLYNINFDNGSCPISIDESCNNRNIISKSEGGSTSKKNANKKKKGGKKKR